MNIVMKIPEYSENIIINMEAAGFKALIAGS